VTIRNRGARGFTLTELAVVFAIIALLIGGAMMTLSAQVEQRTQDETRRRLDAAVEAVLGFAVSHRRLPCPAVSGSTGDESPAGGGTCTTNFSGFLPAKTIGFQPTDSSGYALDAWSNRIRYVVATGLTGCTGSSTAPHFTSSANLKANGVSCRPNNLLVCASATGITEGATPSCGATANQVTGTEIVAFAVYSTGKNGAITTAYGPDETENVTNNAAGAVLIHRTPSDSGAAAGNYDDLVAWVPVGVLYSRLIYAGVLP
jgi:prepilin-type N-terminal cleavage/methylation domain-containing protein